MWEGERRGSAPYPAQGTSPLENPYDAHAELFWDNVDSKQRRFVKKAGDYMGSPLQ